MSAQDIAQDGQQGSSSIILRKSLSLILRLMISAVWPMSFQNCLPLLLKAGVPGMEHALLLMWVLENRTQFLVFAEPELLRSKPAPHHLVVCL